MRINFLLPAFFLFIFHACVSKKQGVQTTDFQASKTAFVENTSHLQDETLAPFYHGVASGDPYQNSVVIWTRATPKLKVESIPVQWEVSITSSFEEVIASGQADAHMDSDYTVKLIVDDLTPGRIYYYRFNSQGAYSMTGRTKTLPATDEAISLAFASCSNIEFGYFNAYAAICTEDLDAVIHLGDYIYEYGPNVYGDTSFYRKNIPPHEIISLQDYRDRYSQYRLDPDLQCAHSQFPFINVWDDHEITNNAFVDGAQNHQENEGDYELRKQVARQAFYEWLPIREDKNHYRAFQFGNTAELIMLDERLAGRTQQPENMEDPNRFEPDHTLLGEGQMAWLTATLSDSDATWKLIGNQVIFSYCDWGYPSFSRNMDAWDGYPRDQETLARCIRQNKLDNVLFITGDTHTAWAFEATYDPFNQYDPDTGEGAIGIELGVTSISSRNANERNPDEEVRAHEKKISSAAVNPHLKYVNMRDHGYLKLTISEDEITAEYKTIPTLKTQTASSQVDKKFLVKNGQTKLIPVE